MPSMFAACRGASAPRARWLLIALLGASPAAAPGHGLAQSATEPWVQILEPKEWSGAGTRGIVVQPRKTLRVTGLAQHPAGVREVLINGKRAAFGPHTSGAMRFEGYVEASPSSNEVEIAVYGTGGAPLIKSYRMTTTGMAPVVVTSAEAALSQKGFRGQRWAIVVGVSEYADKRITPLQYADDDARAFYKFLTSERAGLGGFKRENGQQ